MGRRTYPCPASVNAHPGDTAIKHHLAVLRLEHFIITNDSLTNSTVEPFHDTLVDVIWKRTAIDRKVEASRKLAFVLNDRKDHRNELIACLLEQGSEFLLAREFYLKAGRVASEAFAFAQAAIHFSNAYRLGEAVNVNTQQSIQELADSLADAGQSARAAETYLEAANLGDAGASFDLRRQAATCGGNCSFPTIIAAIPSCRHENTCRIS